MDSSLNVTSVDFYLKTVVGKDIEEVEKMRKIALFSNIEENFGVS